MYSRISSAHARLRPAVTDNGLTALLRKLRSIEIGPKKSGDRARIRPAVLAELLRLLLTLLENGLTLPKALASLSKDRSTRNYSHILRRMQLTMEAGGSLSRAMEYYPRTFTSMQVQQIRIGEKSGAIERALGGVCAQLERYVALRKRLVKKTSYPILVSIAGTGLMIFMCVVVVPEFETVYAGSGVDLPAVTQVVTGLSRLMITWGWLALPVFMIGTAVWIAARARPTSSRTIDALLLRIPLIGPWLRDIAVLQFAEGISAMVECGYTPVEAIQVAAQCVKNREIRAVVHKIQLSVERGEKLSNELDKYERFFSATLCQLVSVGEQSGDFPRAMRGTCTHMRERRENRVDTTVGMLEPTLTILLAIAIGAIVLSIYMPMFHMFEVLE